MQLRLRSAISRILLTVLFPVLWAAPTLRASLVIPGLYAAVDNAVIEVAGGGGPATVATGYSPAGLAFDGDGNLFAADPNTGNVYKVSRDGGVSTFASGLSGPFGVAVDGAGNVWVSQPNFNQVVQIAPGGSQTPYFAGAAPTYMTFDRFGDLFVSDALSNDIMEIDSLGNPIPFAFGIQNPAGLAFDAAGFLYVASGDGNIYKYDTNGNSTIFGSGLISPGGLAFDSAGILYAADAAAGAIYAFIPDGTQSTFLTGLTAPAGLAYGAVPEPGVWCLTLAGLAALAWKRRG